MKLLICDDQHSVYLYLTKVLDFSSLGFTEVVYAENGAVALQQMKEHPVDVMILDIQMPVMNGLELLERLRTERLPQPETIVLSAFDEFVYAKKCIEYGVRSYVLKPIDPQEITANLLSAVETIRKTQCEQLRHAFALACAHIGKQESGSISNMMATFPFLVLCAPAKEQVDLTVPFATILDRQTSGDFQFVLVQLQTKEKVESKVEERQQETYVGMSSVHRALNDMDDAVREAYTDALWYLNRQGQTEQGKDDAEIIFQVRAYVDVHFAEDLSLNRMSERFYISRFQISRLFKQLIGMNYQDYVLSVRMNAAAEMLTKTQAKLYEISEATGFDEPSYFSNVFKKYFGVSPKTYRHSGEEQHHE